MTILEKVVDKLKGFDQFGYPIMMNFRGDTTYNTLPGGIVSLVLNGFLAWLSITNLITLFTHGGDTIL